VVLTEPQIIDAFIPATRGNLAVSPLACPPSISFFPPSRRGSGLLALNVRAPIEVLPRARVARSPYHFRSWAEWFPHCARRTILPFPPLYKNGVEGVVTQLRPSTSHILMWGVREQEGHPLYPMTALP
jgi:hypothetical protein